MADTPLAEFAPYDDVLDALDDLYFVDAGGPTKKRIEARRFCVTDGNMVDFTGGGTFELAGFMLTATGSGTVSTVGDVETYTNKTLVAPTIADLTNMQHSHDDPAGGGPLMPASGSFEIYHAQTGLHPETTEDTWVDEMEENTDFWLHGDHIPEDATMRLMGWAHPANKVLSFRVYNATDAVNVANSEVTVYGNEWTSFVSNDFRLGVAAGLKRYFIQIYNASSGGDDAVIINLGLMIQ